MRRGWMGRQMGRWMKKLLPGMIIALCFIVVHSARVWGAGAVYSAYQEYEAEFAQIQTIDDIPARGYIVVEKHVFDVPLVSYYPQETVKTGQGAEDAGTQGLETKGAESAVAEDVEGEEGHLGNVLETLRPTEVVRPENIYQVVPEDAVALQEVPTVRFYCALEEKSHRAAVFLADAEGRIVYKTNRLECNYTVLGELNQPIYDMVSVAFQDLNGDGLTDILLIAGCTKAFEDGERKNYKIGEVLFQQKKTEGDGAETTRETDEATRETDEATRETAETIGEAAEVVAKDVTEDTAPIFYRDWRINDKINRFSMNQSAKSIRSFVRDGQSTEFLYTATMEKELLSHGFHVIEEQSYVRTYEKLGTLKILPGYYSLGDYDIFMIYMINEQGAIVWSFEPMGDYDNLYALRGISTTDLDGDGMKDLLVLGRYSREGEKGELIIDTQYAIYYQRTDGFEQDTEFKFQLSGKGKEEQTVSNLVNEVRRYWGWQIELKEE